MAKAQVELVGSLSINVDGRDFVKGRPQLITNSAEIVKFQARPDFRVKVLPEQTGKPEEKAAPKAESKPKAAPLPEPVEEPTPEPPAEEKPIPKSPSKGKKYTRTKLNQMRKSELVEIGLQFGLAFSGDESAKQMVSDIMLAQED